MENLETKAIRLISNLDKTLYLNFQLLRHTSGNKYAKFENIKEYLKKLEALETKLLAKEHLKYLYEVIYSKYIIKKENIKNSYLEFRKRILLEKGYGNLLNDNYEESVIKEVINNQKKSLDVWLNYLFLEENTYPFWIKYWALKGILKIGSFDDDTNSYNHRGINTISPFIELNKKAFQETVFNLIEYLKNDTLDNKEIENIVKTGSFSKIYPYFLKKITKGEKEKENNEGMWVHFPRFSNPSLLVESIEGYNTNWCTAVLSVAKSQLERGDFYIYFTKDLNNEFKIPRIAIRMEDEAIAEIRGVGKSQDVEAELTDVLKTMLNTYFKNDLHYKKLEDMEEVTKIYNKNKAKQELSIEELRFLYQLDNKIIGFGYDGDIRVSEIIKSRDIKSDLSRIFNCQKEEVAILETEITNLTKVYYGNFLLDSDNLLITPQIIVGNIKISNWQDRSNIKFLTEKLYGNIEFEINGFLDNIVFPKEVYGSLNMHCFLIEDATLKNITFPKFLRDDLNLLGAIKLINSTLPAHIGKKANIYWLREISNTILPSKIEEETLRLPNIKDITGLILPLKFDYKIETRYEVLEPKEIIKRKSLK